MWSGICLSAAWAVAKLCNRRCIPRPGRHLHGRNGLGMVVAVASGMSSPTANRPAIKAGIVSSAYRSFCGRCYVASFPEGRSDVWPTPRSLVGLWSAAPLCTGRVRTPLLSYRIFSPVKPIGCLVRFSSFFILGYVFSITYWLRSYFFELFSDPLPPKHTRA